MGQISHRQCALLLLQTRGLLPGSCIPSGKAKSKQQNTRYSGVALQGLCLAFGKAMWPTLLCQPSDHNKHEAAIFFPMIRCTQAWTGHRQHQPMTSQATAPRNVQQIIGNQQHQDSPTNGLRTKVCLTSLGCSSCAAVQH